MDETRAIVDSAMDGLETPPLSIHSESKRRTRKPPKEKDWGAQTMLETTWVAAGHRVRTGACEGWCCSPGFFLWAPRVIRVAESPSQEHYGAVSALDWSRCSPFGRLAVVVVAVVPVCGLGSHVPFTRAPSLL